MKLVRGWFLVLLVLMIPVAVSADYKKTKIAVLDFQQNGRFETQDVGKMVAEWFTTSLVETGRFDIIERRLLQQLLEEQKMSASGLIDPTSASRLGRVLGVTTVVTGTVQSFDGTYEINARLINVETGSIIVAEKVRAPSATSLTDLVSSIAGRIIRNFPLHGYVVQHQGDRVMIDLGRQAGVRSGMTFSIYTEGKQIKHPRTRELLDVERREQGTVLIDEIKEKTSSGTVTSEKCSGCIKVGMLVRGVLAEDEPLPVQRPAAVETPGDRERGDSRPERRAPETDRKEKRETRERETVPPAQPKAVLEGHGGDIASIAFSPDGALAATGDRKEQIIVWDCRTWKQIATLKGHRGSVQALSFNSRGRYLAAGDRDETAIVWDLARTSPLQTIKTGKDVNALAWSPDGARLATGLATSETGIWNGQTGARLTALKGGSDVFALAWSPDGARLATAGKEKVVRLWEVGSGTARLLEGHRDDVRALAFSPGGKLLASAGDDRTIILWNPADGSQQKRLVGHENGIVFLGISRDGHRLVSAEARRSSGTLIVWDMKSGLETRRIRIDRKPEAVAMDPDGRSVLVGSDRQALLYLLD